MWPSQRGEEEEQRVDPADGELVTWRGLQDKYAEKYNGWQVGSYWNTECRPTGPPRPRAGSHAASSDTKREVGRTVVQRSCASVDSDKSGSDNEFAWWKGELPPEVAEARRKKEEEKEDRKNLRKKEPDPWQLQDPWGGGASKPEAAAAHPRKTDVVQETEKVRGTASAQPEQAVPFPDPWLGQGVPGRDPDYQQADSHQLVEPDEDGPASSVPVEGVVDEAEDSAEREGNEVSQWTSPQNPWEKAWDKPLDPDVAPMSANDAWSGWRPSRGPQEYQCGKSDWSEWKPRHAWKEQRNDWDDSRNDRSSWDRERQQSRGDELAYWQDWYRRMDIGPGKSEAELREDDIRLFSELKVEDDAGVDYSLNVVGERTGKMPNCESFEDIFRRFKGCIPEDLRQNIIKCGYSRLTSSQRYSIPAALSGRDVLCLFQSGVGKAVAFLLPLLASMMMSQRGLCTSSRPFVGPCKPDTLILAPARELCQAIFEEASRLCHRTAYRVVQINGQDKVNDQLGQIAKGADVVVATPGRLWDFVSGGVLQLSGINCLAIDDVDRMAKVEDMFKELLDKHGMPPKDKRQTMLFCSASAPASVVRKFADECLYEPVRIKVGKPKSADGQTSKPKSADGQTNGTGGSTAKRKAVVGTKDQDFVLAPAEEKGKIDLLSSFMNEWRQSSSADRRLLVFRNCKNRVQHAFSELARQGIADLAMLHSVSTLEQAQDAFQMLKDGRARIVIVDDAAATCLGNQCVTDVVNVDLPRTSEVYQRRLVNCQARGSRSCGRAVSFVVVDDEGRFWDEPNVLRSLPGLACRAGVPDWLRKHAQLLDEVAIPQGLDVETSFQRETHAAVDGQRDALDSGA